MFRSAIACHPVPCLQCFKGMIVANLLKNQDFLQESITQMQADLSSVKLEKHCANCISLSHMRTSCPWPFLCSRCMAWAIKVMTTHICFTSQVTLFLILLLIQGAQSSEGSPIGSKQCQMPANFCLPECERMRGISPPHNSR